MTHNRSELSELFESRLQDEESFPTLPPNTHGHYLTKEQIKGNMNISATKTQRDFQAAPTPQNKTFTSTFHLEKAERARATDSVSSESYKQVNRHG